MTHGQKNIKLFYQSEVQGKNVLQNRTVLLLRKKRSW